MCRGARNICPPWVAAACPGGNEEWCGRAASHFRSTSPIVLRQRHRADAGRWTDENAHSTHTAADQPTPEIFYTLSTQQAHLCGSCALRARTEADKKRTLQGKRMPFQDLASPCSPLPPPPSRRGFSAKSLPCTDPRGWGSTGSRFPANGGGQSGRMGGRRREGRAADRRCSQWPPSVVCRALSSAGAGSGGADG